QTTCRDAPHGATGGDAEVPPEMFELVTFYARNLAVPARRNVDDPQVLRGKALFYATGCAGCHRPKFVTRRDSPEPEQSFQLIWPYTDLLLHDMGEGLADGRPEGEAGGREWRTAPLWGIGLNETVSEHMFLLHDGRTRGIRWVVNFPPCWRRAGLRGGTVSPLPSRKRALMPSVTARPRKRRWTCSRASTLQWNSWRTTSLRGRSAILSRERGPVLPSPRA